MLEPWHIVSLGDTVTTTLPDTVTVTEAVPVQPLASVPVTVYVVVIVGLALTTEPVVWFSPVAGDHT